MLADVFNPRRNSLNAIRLLLALAVIVSHAWPLIGAKWEPSLGGLTLGSWAVAGFFAISGFLITRSRINGRPARDYWAARALRILPGLVVVLLVVAFVFAPIASAIEGGGWDLRSAVTYVLRDVPLYPPKLYQETIGTTLDSAAYVTWDGSLWTLFWEGLCYVVVGVGVTLISSRRHLTVLSVAAFAIGTVIGAAHLAGAVPLPGLLPEAVTAMTAFAAGAFIVLTIDRVPVRPVLIVVAAAILAASLVTDTAAWVAPLPLTYLLLVLGAYLPLHHVGAKFDASYGVYIYAWPVAQMWILLLGKSLTAPLLILLDVAVTVPVAYASCVLVERPALRLKPGRGQKVTRVPA